MIAVSTSTLGFCAERLGRRLDRLLVPRREGPQGVLDAIAELAEDGVGDVEGVLGDEVDAHALGADEPHDLLDLLHAGPGARRRTGGAPRRRRRRAAASPRRRPRAGARRARPCSQSRNVANRSGATASACRRRGC
ncbi:MAG: hypothetical protein MZV64_12605 [Ignavibacteriales bacterium]|nr:hypothetical protein [Ignavibacteriales bacterium]